MTETRFCAACEGDRLGIILPVRVVVEAFVDLPVGKAWICGDCENVQYDGDFDPTEIAYQCRKEPKS